MTFSVPNLGVIEGFYGKTWSDESRLLMAHWLPEIGIDSYLYAPKSDSALRKGWREAWPTADRDALHKLSAACSGSGLALHIGLSPYALYESYGPKEQQVLVDRVTAIVDLGVTGLAILFDDMPGGFPELAARQLAIVEDVQRALAGHPLLVCPTYYSDDPVLDRVFGDRPERYLEDFCAGLDADVGVFWTGPEVCSQEISAAHLARMTERCGRRVYLWDNYPVNDSKVRSEHLYVQPLNNRNPEAAQWLGGHWCNAMNQPALSLSALASLPALYGRRPVNDAAVMSHAGLSEALLNACEPLARLKKQELSSEQLAALKNEADGDSLAASELADWLAGEYTFDPACLTD